VIIGQMHAETPNSPPPIPKDGYPVITLYHEGLGSTTKKIKLAVYYSPDGSVTNAGNQDQTLDIVSGVNAGDRIDYQLTLVPQQA